MTLLTIPKPNYTGTVRKHVMDAGAHEKVSETFEELGARMEERRLRNAQARERYNRKKTRSE